jgi:Domain of unknown function (DUF222)
MSETQRTVELCTHFHAASAELVKQLLVLDNSREWEGVGFRTCGHWLSVNAGMDQWRADEMIRVGHALEGLPLIAEAFAVGRLSYDKVRALIACVSAEDQEIWLDVATAASATQLARICRSFRAATVIDDPKRNEQQHAERTFNAWWLENGMLRVVATLPPEDGRIVLNAVEDAAKRAGDAATSDSTYPAHDTFGARQADALTRIAERWCSGSADGRGRAPRQLVVHVDVQTVLGEDSEGRCHLEDGAAMAAGFARRIGCDAEVLALIERGGTTLDLVQAQAPVSGRIRRALQLRDGYCRYPACTVPAVDCDGHHIVGRFDGGPTRLPNLVSLCAYHHQRYHEGAFQIAKLESGGIEFCTPEGRAIAPARPLPATLTLKGSIRQLSALSGRSIQADAATAGDHGAPYDHGLTVEMLAGSRLRARAGPG